MAAIFATVRTGKAWQKSRAICKADRCKLEPRGNVCRTERLEVCVGKQAAGKLENATLFSSTFGFLSSAMENFREESKSCIGLLYLFAVCISLTLKLVSLKANDGSDDRQTEVKKT